MITVCSCRDQWHLSDDPDCRLSGGDGGGGNAFRGVAFAALFSLPIWAVIALLIFLAVR